MKKQLKNILKIVLSLALGAFIFWFAYRKTDTHRMGEILRSGVHYEWLGISILLGILSDWFRALRWKMLIDVLDRRRTSTLNVFYATMIGYFANLLFPRAGEVIRCSVVGKYEGVSFTKVIGTMIAERAFDLLFLGLICLATILLQMDFFIGFFTRESLMLGGLHRILPYAGAGLALVGLLLFLFRKQIHQSSLARKVKDMLLNIWQGVKTFLHVRSKFWFLFHGLMVWALYVAMLYACIFAFDFTAGLPLAAVLTVFVMGSLGVIIPVQGGIGTFHALTIIALAFYGIGADEAGVFALLAHGAQMVLLLVAGLASLIGLQFRTPYKPEKF